MGILQTKGTEYIKLIQECEKQNVWQTKGLNCQQNITIMRKPDAESQQNTTNKWWKQTP